jgi:hypothetical protein
MAVMIVLVVGSVAGWLAWNSRDIPAPDVSDVTLQRRELAAEQDAYTHFVRAGAALVWPEDVRFTRSNPEPRPDDEARIVNLVAANAEALRHLQAGLACEECLGPQDLRPDSTWPVHEFRNLGKLVGAQTRCELRADHLTQAVAACADGLRYGDLLARDTSFCNRWLLGVANLGAHAVWARMIANDPEVSESNLVDLLRVVNAVTPLERGLERAFKGKFMMADGVISQLGNGTMEMPQGGENSRIPNWLPLPTSYLFQPNRCRLAAAKLARAEIRAIPQWVTESLPEHDASGLTGKESKYELLSKPNMIGRILLDGVAVSQFRLVHTKARINGQLDGTRLVVALRLFEKRTGKLPATLAELVPAYLPAVPRDPYDGRPFRYSPEKRVVYAVGMDLKDSDGTKAPPRKPGTAFQTDLDEVFELDAAAVE